MQIRVGSSAKCMDVDVNNVENPVEDSDDTCIILIQFFGSYYVLEVLHGKVACVINTREVLHAKVACARNTREVLHARVACRMNELHVACKDIPLLLRGSVEVCNKK